jgi:hypothetical protein
MDEEWLREYYEGLGYDGHRIEQIIANSKAVEKEKQRAGRGA